MRLRSCRQTAPSWKSSWRRYFPVLLLLTSHPFLLRNPAIYLIAACAQLETHGPGAPFSAAAYPVHIFLVQSWQVLKTSHWIACSSIQKAS